MAITKRKMQCRQVALCSKTEVRVRFSEIDSMRVVWHGEYVRYFEDGRENFGRTFKGLSYEDIAQSGIWTPVVELHIDFFHPLKMDEIIIVETHYIKTSAAKICFDYIIYRQSLESRIVAKGYTTQVFIDSEGNLMLNPPEYYVQWQKQWGIV
jgi:acyl-CoA thioester hydrolase